MKKLIIVYNPRSSHFWQVEKHVIIPSRQLKGWMVGKFEVQPTIVDENAQRLASIIRDGDLVVAAGGDATATISVNAVMLSKAKNVRLGVLGFGNFNDVARCFGNLEFEDVLKHADEPQAVFPLECSVNGAHWRYGMCYFTIGMFAEACSVFDHPKTRKHLQKKSKRHTVFSLWTLAWWWLKNHRRQFMPTFELGNSSEEYVKCEKRSDYLAVNGITVAKLMKGGKWYLQDTEFLSSTGRLTRFFRLVPFMLKSMWRRVPGITSDFDQIIFNEPADVMLQAEGEYKKLEAVELIEIRKSRKPIMAIMK